MNTFLNGIEFPTINKLSCDSLEENIQIEEIKESIASMKSGKAPGPDGFPSEFYKAQFYFCFFQKVFRMVVCLQVSIKRWFHCS